MLIILDKAGKEIKDNLGTNSLYPNGDLPYAEKEDEIYIRLNDNSDFAKQIMSAYDYELVLDENHGVTDVIVHKTLEEYLAEQPDEPIPPTEIEELTDYVLDVDFRLILVEMGLL